jgi:hypothetical protein
MATKSLKEEEAYNNCIRYCAANLPDGAAAVLVVTFPRPTGMHLTVGSTLEPASVREVLQYALDDVNEYAPDTKALPAAEPEGN